MRFLKLHRAKDQQLVLINEDHIVTISRDDETMGNEEGSYIDLTSGYECVTESPEEVLL